MATLDEAYLRFRSAGPEWGADQLTNHGPMASEVLVRRGRADELESWVDAYIRRLDDLPVPSDPIDDANWAAALGDGTRIADWTAYFERQVAEQPWRDVLLTWWPRLLPGIVAGTTHGVIRTGHAVRALTADAAGPAAVDELAHGLAYWAARYLMVPGAVPPGGSLGARAALDAVARIPAQSGQVARRLGQLAGMSDWPASLAALRAPAGPDDTAVLLADLVTAATLRYRTHGHASPVLLVHTATAPNAVLHTLPALPADLWTPSLAAVWAVTAAVIAAYAPVRGAPESELPAGAAGIEDALDAAVAHGDEHVIKFADTAAEVYARTGDQRALGAAARITTLIDSPRRAT